MKWPCDGCGKPPTAMARCHGCRYVTRLCRACMLNQLATPHRDPVNDHLFIVSALRNYR
jgi:hypothetical protein